MSGESKTVDKQIYKMNEEHIAIISREWPRIEVLECLGEGGFGTVYKVKKHTPNSDIVQTLAVKIVSLPRDINDLNTYLWDMQSDEEGKERILKELVEKAENEIRVEMELKDPHIVTIHDHAIIKKEDGLGYYVLICMDLLESFEPYMKKSFLGTREEVEVFARKVGCDICDALIACEKKKIVHRDIKPNNILVNEDGDFVLTDFGLAKEIDTMASRSNTGTPAYRAPEIESGKYGAEAKKIDIYSLGIVLYQICNHGRFPFLPPHPEKIGLAAQADAYQKKMQGEKMPLPQNCSEMFGMVILKACEFDAENRYADAESFKKAIMNPELLCEEPPVKAKVIDKQQEKSFVNTEAYMVKDEKKGQEVKKDVPKKKKKGSFAIVAVILIVVLAGAGAIFLGSEKPEQSAENVVKEMPQKEETSVVEEEESTVVEKEVENIDICALFAQNEMTYEEALTKLEEMNLDASEKKEIKAELSNMQNSHSAYEKGKTYYDNGFYEEAKEQLARVLEEDGYYADAEYMLNTCSTMNENAILTSAEEYANAGNYEEAIRCLSQYLESVESSVQADVALMKYQDTYADNVIQQTNELLEQVEYEEAISILEAATELLPENQAIAGKYEECLKYKPADLSVLPVPELTKGCYVTSEEQEAKDTIGNIYNAENMALAVRNIRHNDGMGCIYLGSNYNNVTFTLACGDKAETGISSKENNVNIYLDDELVDSFSVTRSFAPIEVTYDTKDRNILKVEVFGQSSYIKEVIISDLKAWN